MEISSSDSIDLQDQYSLPPQNEQIRFSKLESKGLFQKISHIFWRCIQAIGFFFLRCFWCGHQTRTNLSLPISRDADSLKNPVVPKETHKADSKPPPEFSELESKPLSENLVENPTSTITIKLPKPQPTEPQPNTCPSVAQVRPADPIDKKLLLLQQSCIYSLQGIQANR